MTEVALATSIPPRMRRPGPGGEDAGPAWRTACLASWAAPGWRVVTVNPAEEFAALGALPPEIGTANAAPGVADVYGRAGTWVGDALARAVSTGAPVVGLVNADIRLDLRPARRAALAERASRAMLVCNRMDVGHAAQAAGPFYRYGYDLVLMPREMAGRLALDGFALGVPWWDYWVVLDALLQDLPVQVVQCDGIRHLAHPQAWNQPAWRRALGVLMANLGPRRAALERLGMGAVAEAVADLLLAIAPRETEGYPLDDMMTVAGTRFGIEIVRLAERRAWRLD
ncbi:hypothetical protein [Neoroseomonas soli]|uniref:Glycosyltransferase n=1 Tax=Neoroseomonas soli TaxID=1081025 RepID=A0A9X9WXN6_9PROT|nr:hypothetical protein [Neoroseomonas soli]MBR0671915.1 hypothetical protein [Neoroseomonas soli]